LVSLHRSEVYKYLHWQVAGKTLSVAGHGMSTIRSSSGSTRMNHASKGTPAAEGKKASS
jgi:hypothetical protein